MRNTKSERVYPYIVARDRHVNWEFYLTVKPNKRVYIQAVSKDVLQKTRRKTPAKRYENNLRRIEDGFASGTKTQYAREFYQSIFKENAIVTD